MGGKRPKGGLGGGSSNGGSSNVYIDILSGKLNPHFRKLLCFSLSG